MRRTMFPVVTVILVALIVTGLLAAKDVNSSQEAQVIESANSSSPADASMRDMTLQSELIVNGRCVDSRSAWIEDGRLLVTLATVEVDEVLKGGQISSVTVVLPGGVDQNRKIPVAMTYAGAPTIASQEEVFLFLTGDDRVSGGYAVMGFAQGKFSVVEDEDGQKLVAKDRTKIRGPRGPGMVRGNRQFAPLSEFKTKVKGYLGQ